MSLYIAPCPFSEARNALAELLDHPLTSTQMTQALESLVLSSSTPKDPQS